MIRHALTLALALSTAAAFAADWPHQRGPRQDGQSPETGVLDFDFDFQTVWKHSLGRAYSAVSIADGKAVTLFSDGEKDVAVAFDAATGQQLWHTAFADTYRGHDGSTDGPVGTPTIDGERVYVVGPFGNFLALSLEDGRVLWSRDLKQDFGARAPIYGFSATPLVIGERLFLQAGGEDGHSVVALDRRSGELLWHAGDDRIDHPTPVVMDLGGERLLISVGSTHVTVLRPVTGEVVWSHPHSDRPPFDPTYPQAVPLSDSRILLTFEDEVVLYKLARSSEKLEELWRSRAFGKSSARPVAHDGHLYGFKGQFLTCVDMANGKVAWKSRPPGGRGLILVDGHLLVLGSSGWLTAVEATPEGYREKARLRVLEQGGYTAPSFADGRVFVRNLEQVASVRVVRREAGGAASTASIATASDGPFAAWVRRVEEAVSAESKKRLVDAFMGRGSFPVVEGDGRVVFVYRGPAEAVSVVGDMQADRAVPEPLARVAGTDFFYRAYDLESDGRWAYRFRVDFDEPAPDPLNSRRALGEGEEMSELSMPGFRDPDHIRPVDDASRAGRLEKLEINSAAYGRNVIVQVYLPASYDQGRDDYPLLVLPHGEPWLEADAKHTLDRLFGRVARPAVVAFVPMAGWVGGQWGDRARRLIGEELLAGLDAAFRLDTGAGSAALWTVKEKAAIALDLLRENPRFGAAACQSPALYRDKLPSFTTSERRGQRFFLGWSRYEHRSAELGYDEVRVAHDLRDHLQKAGFQVTGGELVGGSGFRTWRLQAEEILAFLLPLQPSASPEKVSSRAPRRQAR